MRIHGYFSIYLTIAELGILAFHTQSLADFDDTWWKDSRQQENESVYIFGAIRETSGSEYGLIRKSGSSHE